MVSRQNEASQAYNASAWGAITVSPNDTTVIIPVLRGIYVGVTGDVKVRMLNGSTPIYQAVPAGTILPIQCDMVFATGTSASGILGLF